MSLERGFTIPEDDSRRDANTFYYNYADEDGEADRLARSVTAHGHQVT